MKTFLAGLPGENAAKIYWSFNRKTRTGTTGPGDDFPYLIDSADQSVSFWSRRNHLDCNFLVSLPTGARTPSSKTVDVSPHFLYPSPRGHFRNSLFHSIFFLFCQKFSIFFILSLIPIVGRIAAAAGLEKETVPSFSPYVRNDNYWKSSKTHKFTFSTVKSSAIARPFPPDTHTRAHICAVSRLLNQKM